MTTRTFLVIDTPPVRPAVSLSQAHGRSFCTGLAAFLAVAGLAACASEDRDEPSDGGSDVGTDVGTDVNVSLPEPDNHRPVAVTCDRERPSPPIELGEFPPEGACTTHEECTDGLNGRCSQDRFGYGCTYDTCFEDSECGSNVCACDGGFQSDTNVCLGGNCQVDADCGEGGWCSPSFDECGNYSGVTGYWCRTPEDTCLNDSDCVDPNETGGPGYCMFRQTLGHWECSYSQCVG